MRAAKYLRPSFAIAAVAVSISCSLLPSSTASGAKAPVWREVASMRTASSDTFTNGAGDYRTRLYSSPVNYRSGNAWKRIDSSLIASGKARSTFHNAANSFHVQLDRSLGGAYLHFETPKGRASFSVSLAGAHNTRALRKGANGLSYRDARSHADFDYEVTPFGLKETIELRDRRAPSSYRFELKPGKGVQLHAIRARDGSVRFFARGSSKPAFSILAPTVTDSLSETEGAPPAKGMASMSVQRQRDGRFRLELSIDRKWLSDPARTFPVSLDPSIATYDNTDGFYNYLSGVDAPPDTIHHLELGPRYVNPPGRWDTYAIVINYGLSDGLSPIPRGAVVDGDVNASLYLRGCRTGITACNTSGHYSGVRMYALTTPWSSATPWRDVHYDPTVLASMSFYGNQTPNWYTLWDSGGALASEIQNLLYGDTQFGFLFEASDPSGPSFSFDSYRDGLSYAPFLVVSWHSVAPSYLDQPAINGDTSDAGRTLSVEPGDTDGTWPLSYSHQWQRCNEGGGGCSDIPGATGSQYVLTLADVGSTICVRETVSNALGSASATSDSTEVVGTAPSNGSPPIISGIPKDGEVLSATTGTWSGSAVYQGSPGFHFDYQWYRCDSSGYNCEDISGATDSTYVLTSDDVGSTIEVEVTATNTIDSGSATSGPTSVVQPAPPLNTDAPTISGTARDEEPLGGNKGNWTGTPTITFSYQWLRCDSGGNNCSEIDGATSLTGFDTGYELKPEDVGSTIKLQVTAQREGDDPVSATSAPTGVVQPAPPLNTAIPTIGGGPFKDGQKLFANSDGVWRGTPPKTFTYQWRRCDSAGDNCLDISGATEASYQITSDDIGKTIRLQVTADNAAPGTTSATSAATGEGEPLKPSNTALPAISGKTEVGQTLSTTHGSWEGSPPIDFTYQWRRCDLSASGCSNISGATGSSYTVVPSDEGHSLTVAVTAINAGGSATAISGAVFVLTAKTSMSTGYLLQLTASPTNVLPTDPIVYSVQMRNMGSTSLYLDHLNITLPEGFTFVPGSTSGAVTLAPVISGRTVSWSGVPEVGAGKTALFQFTVNAGTTSGTFASQVDSSADSLAPVTLENAAPVTVDAQPVLKLDSDAEWLDTGSSATLTGTLINPTSTALPVSRISVVLPSGLEYGAGSASASLGDPEVDGQTLRWDAPASVAANSQLKFTFAVTSVTAKSAYDVQSIANVGAGTEYTAAERLSGQGKEDLAYLLRPYLYFDSDEPWRPLNVARFLREKTDSNYWAHSVCFTLYGDNSLCTPRKVSASAERALCANTKTLNYVMYCDPFTAMNRVMGAQVDDSKARVDINNSLGGPGYENCEERTKGVLCDANIGNRAKLYYHPVVKGGTLYLDYWIYYRYNQTRVSSGRVDMHEGDWEGLVVATSPGGEDTGEISCLNHNILWAAFRAHVGTYRYSCAVLKWGNNSHIKSYVAKGTHATYPRSCGSSDCMMNENVKVKKKISWLHLTIDVPYQLEGRFNGKKSWGYNSKECQDDKCLKVIPEKKSSFPDQNGFWAYWKGNWGGSSAFISGPGNKKYFDDPSLYAITDCSSRTVFSQGIENTLQNFCQNSAYPGGVRVPSVVGKKLKSAASTLLNAGLVLNPVYKYSRVVKDTIIKQYPLPTTTSHYMAPSGSTVHVIVASRKRVPPVRGLSENLARTILTNENYQLSIKGVKSEPSVDVAKDHVTRTAPAAGSSIAPKDKVVIWISEGPPKVVVPSIIGLTPKTAKQKLKDRGLGAAAQNSVACSRKIITKQKPASGYKANKGTDVKYWLKTCKKGSMVFAPSSVLAQGVPREVGGQGAYGVSGTRRTISATTKGRERRAPRSVDSFETTVEDGKSCGSWFGPMVVALVCDENVLRNAKAGDYRAGGRFGIDVNERGVVSGSGPGYAQALGTVLQSGDSASIFGSAPTGTRLGIRLATSDGGTAEAMFGDVGLENGGRVSLEIVKDGRSAGRDGVPDAVLSIRGKKVNPKIVNITPGSPHVLALRMTRRGLRVSFTAAAKKTGIKVSSKHGDLISSYRVGTRRGKKKRAIVALRGLKPQSISLVSIGPHSATSAPTTVTRPKAPRVLGLRRTTKGLVVRFAATAKKTRIELWGASGKRIRLISPTTRAGKKRTVVIRLRKGVRVQSATLVSCGRYGFNSERAGRRVR